MWCGTHLVVRPLELGIQVAGSRHELHFVAVNRPSGDISTPGDFGRPGITVYQAGLMARPVPRTVVLPLRQAPVVVCNLVAAGVFYAFEEPLVGFQEVVLG